MIFELKHYVHNWYEYFIILLFQDYQIAVFIRCQIYIVTNLDRDYSSTI